METNISRIVLANDSSYNATIVTNASRYNLVESIAMCLILGGIIITTIIGNILVCVCIFLVRKLRRPCNYLLVSLAVSDLCVAILVMPMALIYEIKGKWIFGEIACNLWVSLDVLSCTSSILNLCMISVDRYYAITKPLEYGVKRTPRRMTLWIVLVWCLAAMISLPPLLIIGNEHTLQEEGGEIVNDVCLVSQDIVYQIYATMFSFYIPLTVMITVYYKIFRAARRIVNEERRAQSHLEPHCYLEISVKNGEGPPQNKISSQSPANSSKVNHRSSSASTNTVCSLDPTVNFKSRHSNESQCPMLSSISKQTSKLKHPKASILSAVVKASPSTNSHQKKLRFQLAKERKASTTLGIIMSAFIFCWLPFFVLALVRPFLDETTSVLNTLSSLFLWLGYANSLFNPIIYATLNRDFRKPFKAILYFRCGSLNHMMREDFYHSQYGDPDQGGGGGGGGGMLHSARYQMDYEEGVEYIEAEGDLKVSETEATAHESFL
ncbi:5-hydroxytryptamine receptor 1-like [Anthonomus grandis grandis]|uniref:5-hydroxytryptamine receptor 1-like n=1 Tax=Anthonomus grandis grandis TaxID=2921223 RepID=UPI0021669646|nr:5-hydroxytryptamine receptor 1-like [Anthonomus grandis grandis]XP_050304710.1 5-hydroxytryptamine receptor 1-like [Anthonomus grandis grandis]XP_050304711.1 5-hydroxytryptamine receptor 1-like [Anthonomus grandis grandis]XP_050304712.1 5-hydroxytryptamine receptor 1-like [Anthonomus grandis grandis]